MSEYEIIQPVRAVNTDQALQDFIKRGEELERRLATDPEFARTQEQRDADLAREEKLKREIEAETEQRMRLIHRGIPMRCGRLIHTRAIHQSSAMQTAAAFMAQDERRLLVLSGRPGCGKTLAAAWCISLQCPDRFLDIVGSSWPSDRAPLFRDAGSIVTMPTFGNGSEDFVALQRCSMLAIDDVGMEYCDTKGAWLSKIDQLLNARYADELRTILTTNMTADAFRERYGERIADRIRDAGFGEGFCNVDGPSLRVKP